MRVNSLRKYDHPHPPFGHPLPKGEGTRFEVFYFRTHARFDLARSELVAILLVVFLIVDILAGSMQFPMQACTFF